MQSLTNSEKNLREQAIPLSEQAMKKMEKGLGEWT
jgi:hypothetical protein